MTGKKMIKTVALILTCCILSGCGKAEVESRVRDGADEADYEAVSFNENTETVRELIDATDQTVTLSVWSSLEDQQVTESIIADFKEAFPEVDFDITVGFESEATVKDTVLEAPEKCADVYTFVDDQLNDLVAAGALKEIGTYYTFDVKKANVEASVEAATKDGKLYAYPMTADNGYFLLYDKSVISDKQAGSLESMIAAAKKKNKKIGMHIANGWYLYSFFRGAGFEVKQKEDGGNECNWNAEGGAEVAKAVSDALADGVLVNMDDATMTEGIRNGSLAAVINGTWRAADAQECWDEYFSACKLPTIRIGKKDVQMASFSGCKLVGVNPHTKNPQWAMVLAEYLTCEKNQLRRFEARGLGPSNRMAQGSEKVRDDVAIAGLAQQSRFATVQRVGNSYWGAASELGAKLATEDLNEEEIQKLLDEAVEKMAAAE